MFAVINIIISPLQENLSLLNTVHIFNATFLTMGHLNQHFFNGTSQPTFLQWDISTDISSI